MAKKAQETNATMTICITLNGAGSRSMTTEEIDQLIAERKGDFVTMVADGLNRGNLMPCKMRRAKESGNLTTTSNPVQVRFSTCAPVVKGTPRELSDDEAKELKAELAG